MAAWNSPPFQGSGVKRRFKLKRKDHADPPVGVTAQSLRQLKSKAAEIFTLSGEVVITEADGTVLMDEEYFEGVQPNSLILASVKGSAATGQELAANPAVEEDAESRLSDEELYNIAQRLTATRPLGFKLGFTYQKLQHYDQHNINTLPHCQGYLAMLSDWKTQKSGTRWQLIDALEQSKLMELAVHVRNGITRVQSTANRQVPRPDPDTVTDEEIVNISSNIPPEGLNRLGVALGFNLGQLSSMQTQHNNNIELTAQAILRRWKSQTTDASRKTLQEKLNSAALRRLGLTYLKS